jgi:hypothetical protein
MLYEQTRVAATDNAVAGSPTYVDQSSVADCMICSFNPYVNVENAQIDLSDTY